MEQTSTRLLSAYFVYDIAAATLIPLILRQVQRLISVSALLKNWLQGEKIRVISMPSLHVSLINKMQLTEEILPNAVRRRVAVEMGASQNWYKYVGLDGAVLGIDTFSEPLPPPKVLAEYMAFVENLVKVVRNLK